MKRRKRCFHDVYWPAPGERVRRCSRCKRPRGPLLDAKGRHSYMPGFRRPKRSAVMTFATSAQLARRRRNYKLKKLSAELEALPQSRGRVKLADVLELLQRRL